MRTWASVSLTKCSTLSLCLSCHGVAASRAFVCVARHHSHYGAFTSADLLYSVQDIACRVVVKNIFRFPWIDHEIACPYGHLSVWTSLLSVSVHGHSFENQFAYDGFLSMVPCWFT